MNGELSLYSILKRILFELNSQVLAHGERVAYLYLKFLEHRNIEDSQYVENMMLACIAHDIGAYKTDKFLSLLRFDAENTLEHCIYGYIFMKYFSPLKEDSEVYLYHHTFYEEKDKIDSKYFNDGVLIHLLDRIDVLNIAKKEDKDAVVRQIVESSGTIFNPRDVEDFIAIQKKYNVLDMLDGDLFEEEVRQYFDDEKRFERLLESIINMLAFEVDFKSSQTVIHTITTAHICKILGEKFNLTYEKIDELFLAAKLHDLGKIKVPTAVLEKPGRLTSEEYDEIKKHVGFSKEIIDELFPESVVEISCKHHERLDGSGYPNGLTADDLTIQDRILQVADVASALIYKRSYKDAMPKERVLSILENEKNVGRLDPKVVDMLETHYDEIVDKTRKESEPIINEYENLQVEYKKYMSEYSELNHEKDAFGLLNFYDESNKEIIIY